jgi:hypothetical protein
MEGILLAWKDLSLQKRMHNKYRGAKNMALSRGDISTHAVIADLSLHQVTH